LALLLLLVLLTTYRHFSFPAFPSGNPGAFCGFRVLQSVSTQSATFYISKLVVALCLAHAIICQTFYSCEVFEYCTCMVKRDFGASLLDRTRVGDQATSTARASTTTADTISRRHLRQTGIRSKPVD